MAENKKKPRSAILVLLDAANLLHSAKYFTRTEMAFKSFDRSENELRILIHGYRNHREEKKDKLLVKPGNEPNEA